MRIRKENIRLAKKEGWYDGKNKDARKSWPYEEIKLCIAYDDGYFEGRDSDPDDNRNPYGVYTNDSKTTGNL